MSTAFPTKAAKPGRWSLLKAMVDPDLQCVLLFCALGLLISFYVMIRYPELGAIIAQCGEF